nr:hypothetical protein [Tanacetum cinerariifolium]
MTVEVFYDLRGDYRVVYHDLCLGRPTTKGVGLRVASSHTVNHREDDFTPLETIRRFLGIIRSKSLSSSKGRPLSQRGGGLVSKLLQDKEESFLVPILKFICEVLKYFKVHISRFNPFGMVNLTTFVVMCKAYVGEPNLDLLRVFLNLGPGGNGLTLSTRGGSGIPKALTKHITHIEGFDGKFHFKPDGGFADGGWNSPSNRFVNNDAPAIDVAPLNSAPPSHIAKNVKDSDNVSSRGDIVGEADKLRKSSKVTGKRKQATGSSFKEARHKLQKAPPQTSKVVNNASDPLDVDNDLDIHGKLCTFLASSVLSTKGSYDAIREIEIEKDNEYAECERKCNKALQDLKKNPLVLDMRAEIETLQGQVDGLHKRERLKNSETQLLQDINSFKQDRATVVSKVIPEVATKLIRSDEMGFLVAKLVKAAMF